MAPLRSRKVRENAEAMKASKPYAAIVRTGRRRSHPRHWANLARLVTFDLRSDRCDPSVMEEHTVTK
jgi:hypothetical protein